MSLNLRLFTPALLVLLACTPKAEDTADDGDVSGDETNRRAGGDLTYELAEQLFLSAGAENVLVSGDTRIVGSFDDSGKNFFSLLAFVGVPPGQLPAVPLCQ